MDRCRYLLVGGGPQMIRVRQAGLSLPGRPALGADARLVQLP